MLEMRTCVAEDTSHIVFGCFDMDENVSALMIYKNIMSLAIPAPLSCLHRTLSSNASNVEARTTTGATCATCAYSHPALGEYVRPARTLEGTWRSYPVGSSHGGRGGRQRELVGTGWGRLRKGILQSGRVDSLVLSFFLSLSSRNQGKT